MNRMMRAVVGLCLCLCVGAWAAACSETGGASEIDATERDATERDVVIAVIGPGMGPSSPDAMSSPGGVPRPDLVTFLPPDARVEMAPPPERWRSSDPRYTHVAIYDRSEAIRFTTRAAPGADIDAVGIRSGVTGEIQWARSIEASEGEWFRDGDVTGEPSAFVNWDDGDLSRCPGARPWEGGFASLGGEGGAIRVSFEHDYGPGDTIIVYEVGSCDDGSGEPSVNETIEIHVVNRGSEGDWDTSFIGLGEGPKLEIIVPDLGD